MIKLSNVALADFRRYLKASGLNNIRSNGGHETWARADLTRPVTIQSPIDPVPEFIVKQVLRTLGHSREDFAKTLAS